MDRNLAGTIIAFMVPATLGIPMLLRAQDQSAAQCEHKQHTRYRVVDTGSFGGPNSHMSLGAHILNNSGTFTGYADTSLPDPYAPDGCWDGDCLVAHVFRWKNGELTDLGVLDGGPNSESNWISENGLIAGDSQNGLLDPNGGWEIRGVLWKDDKIIEVGTLDGGIESLARAVNSGGEVVGLSTTAEPDPNAMIMNFGLPFPFQTRAFRWKDGVIQDLGTLGGPDATALGINERGQVIGNSYTSFDPSPSCGSLTTGAFIWQEGKMANLGSLGGTCTGASAINDGGQVVGYSFLAGDEVFHPFLWERGIVRDLGTSGGTFGAAGALNDAGDIAGWRTVPGNDNFIHATVWSRGRIMDLGTLGKDQCSFPFAINSKKQVVGVSAGNCNFDDPATIRAFLWEPGGPMIDLNTLISPSLDVKLLNAAALNDRGEMAVVGFFPDGNHRPVLLIPCDDQEERGDDCEDSAGLNATATMHITSHPAVAPATRNDSVSLPPELRALLNRRFRTHGNK